MTENNQPLQSIISPELPMERVGVRFTIPLELRPGDPCPHCGEGKLDYDGTLNLVCPRCGLVLGGCFS